MFINGDLNKGFKPYFREDIKENKDSIRRMDIPSYESKDEKDTKVIKEEMKSAEKFIEEFDYVLDADVFRQGPIVYL